MISHSRHGVLKNKPELQLAEDHAIFAEGYRGRLRLILRRQQVAKISEHLELQATSRQRNTAFTVDPAETKSMDVNKARRMSSGAHVLAQ